MNSRARMGLWFVRGQTKPSEKNSDVDYDYNHDENGAAIKAPPLWLKMPSQPAEEEQRSTTGGSTDPQTVSQADGRTDGDRQRRHVVCIGANFFLASNHDGDTSRLAGWRHTDLHPPLGFEWSSKGGKQRSRGKIESRHLLVATSFRRGRRRLRRYSR